MDDRACSFYNIKIHAHWFEREGNIRKKDGSINTKMDYRKQGNFCAHIRVPANVEKAVFFTYFAVFGLIPAGLSHKPNRYMGSRLKPAGFEKTIVKFLHDLTGGINSIHLKRAKLGIN